MAAQGLRSVKGPSSPPYKNGPYAWDEHVALHKQSLPFERVRLVENFGQIPKLNAVIDQVYTTEAARAANINFEILGTSSTSALSTRSTTSGAILLTTAGADNDQMIILPHLATDGTGWTTILWGTENQVVWEAIVRTTASVADVTIWAGLKLTNTSVVATDANAAYFRFDGNVANWEATTSITGDDDVESDTGVAVTANTNYYLKIDIDSDRKAHFYINNKEVYVSGALTDDINLIPYIGVHKTTSSGTKAIEVAGQAISRIIFE